MIRLAILVLFLSTHAAAQVAIDAPGIDRPSWTVETVKGELDKWKYWNDYGAVEPFEIGVGGVAIEVTTLRVLEEGDLVEPGDAVLFLRESFIVFDDGEWGEVGERVFLFVVDAEELGSNPAFCSVSECADGTSACCMHKEPGRARAKCLCRRDDLNFDSCDAGGYGAGACSVGVKPEDHLAR